MSKTFTIHLTVALVLSITSCSDDTSQTPDAGSDSYSYSITQFACDSYSIGSSAGAGGGKIFEICGSTVPLTGYTSIRVRKYNGDDTEFGMRPYRVQVSPVGSADCGPDRNYYAVSDDSPTGIGTSSLVFEFQSLWSPGETAKEYCVTASTQSGDSGYNSEDAGQNSWWWSDKIRLERQ